MSGCEVINRIRNQKETFKVYKIIFFILISIGDVPVTAPPPGDVLDLKGQRVGDRWYPADDTAAKQYGGRGGAVNNCFNYM